MKKLLLLSVATMISFSIMAQSSELKLKLEKNKVYRFKSVSSQNVSQTMNGVDQTTTTSSTSVMSLKMVDASAGLIIAEVKFDTIVTHTNIMGTQVNINSASEGNMTSEEAGDVMSSVMNRFSKSAIYVKMKNTGEVTEIVNLKMLSDILLKDTGVIVSKLAPMLKPQITNAVTADALKTMINMYTFNLPAKEIKTGEQWNITTPINAGGLSLEIATNYKVEGMNGNTTVVKSESNIKAAENAAPLEYSGAKITYDDMKGLGKSDMTYDLNTGLLTESFTKTNITGNLNVNASGMAMQIPMNISGETKIKSL